MTPHLSKKKSTSIYAKRKGKDPEHVPKGKELCILFILVTIFHSITSKLFLAGKKSTNSKDVNVDKLAQMWSIISLPRNHFIQYLEHTNNYNLIQIQPSVL